MSIQDLFDRHYLSLVRSAFTTHAQAFPWHWAPQMADEWFGDLRAVRGCARSTTRSYQDALRSFCQYVTDPAYDWTSVCEQRFGTHPIQIVHDWNAAAHVQDTEAEPSKRAFTVEEMQDFFDYADLGMPTLKPAQNNPSGQ